MDVKALQAAQAYQNRLKSQMEESAVAGIAATSGGAEGSSFSDVLKEVVGDTVNTLQQSETARMQALTGKVELSDLVTAVANAELTVNTVVAVRDRVISAYQDILRMPI